MANILIEQAFKALEDIQDVEITAKDLYESKEEYNLPKEVDIDASIYGIDLGSDESEIDEWVSDYLSDTYGFCHYGFDYELDKDNNIIKCSNIKWDTTESLDKYIKEDAEEERVERIKQLKQLYDIEPGDLTDDEIKELRDAGALDEKIEYDEKSAEKYKEAGFDVASEEETKEVFDDKVCDKCGKEVCECDKLQEGPNTTTTISVLDDGEKVIKQVGYSGLTKKIVNGKPVYRVKYAPGYYVKDIEAKHDKEAISRFLGLNEGVNKELEYDYYVVSCGNPYKAIVLNSPEDALQTAKNFNADQKREGKWEVYHYTKPYGGELKYEIIKEELDDVAREEYCVLVNGNNEECYNTEEDAIKFARQRFAEEGNDSEVKVLLVKYGPKDEHGDESELGFETIWASHFEESCNESKEECKDCELAIKYWVDEEHRDQGISELYFGEIKDLEDAKHIADKLFDEYASVEVVKNVDTDHEEVLYGRYPEDESLKESHNPSFSELEEWCMNNPVEMIKTIRRIRSGEMTDGDREVFNDFGFDSYSEEELKNKLDELENSTNSWIYDSGDFSEEEIAKIEKELEESLKEGLTKDEKSVSEEHKEDDKVVCAKCGSEEVKFNDPETKEPLCADCFEKRSAEFEEEVLGKDKLEESITVNINDEEEVKKAKEEVEKSEKDDDEYEQIVDVDAESIDELKDSYVGNVILVCEDCLTPRFIKPELLKKDEETGLYNVGEACPHCGSEKGYKAEGQVAKASVEVDVEKTETTGASESEVKEEEKVEVEEKEERPLPSAMESKEEPSRLEKVDLNEQRFDRLVNKFVHTTYENVENYKTNNLYLDDGNSLIVEGVITYKSGKEKEAHFKLVEKKLSTAKEDVIALTGICEAFNTCEKAFTFRGNLIENKLDLNSLTYNFTTKVLNESKNIKGKVCIKY